MQPTVNNLLIQTTIWATSGLKTRPEHENPFQLLNSHSLPMCGVRGAHLALVSAEVSVSVSVPAASQVRVALWITTACRTSSGTCTYDCCSSISRIDCRRQVSGRSTTGQHWVNTPVNGRATPGNRDRLQLGQQRVNSSVDRSTQGHRQVNSGTQR